MTIQRGLRCTVCNFCEDNMPRKENMKKGRDLAPAPFDKSSILNLILIPKTAPTKSSTISTTYFTPFFAHVPI